MSAVTSSVASLATAAADAASTSKPWYDTSDIDLGPEFYQYQSDVRESMLALASPLNLTILFLILGLIYLRTRSSSSGDITLDPTRPVTFRTFTPRTLLKYNGLKNTMNPEASVYLAVKGKVYDVSAGRNFYGPGGPYENFAGRDATRGLACQSFDEEMLTKDLDGPLDPCADLDADQLDNLKGWEERFDEKYLIVGKLKAYNQSTMEF